MRAPVGILLAAGASVRFGSDKLLHPMADGSPMAVAAAASMLSVLVRVVAVVRQEGPLAAMLRLAGAEVVICPRAASGMGASLAGGVAATAAAGGWIVGLADMPFVLPATIAAVADALADGAAFAAPALPDGRRGHPVGFSARWQQSLLALSGDRGARELLDCHRDELRLVPTTDEGSIFDVDLPSDIRRHSGQC
jgi:molybdenum cofactor cytidylyltransferase